MVMLMMPLMVLEEGMTTRVLKFVETNFYSRMIMTTTTTKTTDAQPRINEQTNNRTNDRTNGWTERTKNTRILDGTRLLDEVLGTHGRNCTSPYSKTQNTHKHTTNVKSDGRSNCASLQFALAFLLNTSSLSVLYTDSTVHNFPPIHGSASPPSSTGATTNRAAVR